MIYIGQPEASDGVGMGIVLSVPAVRLQSKRGALCPSPGKGRRSLGLALHSANDISHYGTATGCRRSQAQPFRALPARGRHPAATLTQSPLRGGSSDAIAEGCLPIGVETRRRSRILRNSLARRNRRLLWPVSARRCGTERWDLHSPDSLRGVRRFRRRIPGRNCHCRSERTRRSRRGHRGYCAA